MDAARGRRVGLLLLVAAALVTLGHAAAPVDDDVVQTLQTKGKADIFVVMREVQTGDYVMEALRWKIRSRDRTVPRAERREAVFRLRSMKAEASQNYLMDWLRTHKVPKVRSFWISNAIFVPDASSDLVRTLAAREDVARIRHNREAALIAPVNDRSAAPVDAVSAKPVPRVFSAVAQRELEWNVVQIGADIAWQTTRGEGVTVANIDTGVRQTHSAVNTTYRGYVPGQPTVHDYNWFDPKEFARDPWWCDPSYPMPDECRTDDPFDNTGHGTHTMGTIAGSLDAGIGVAPGVKWIAAKGCRDGSCLDYGLISSAEWVICPTTIRGTAPNCSLGADIVANSWGGARGDSFYMDWTSAWVEAGMLPVFSQGNSGPRCSTAGSPGEFDTVIGVGATDQVDGLAEFSSRGPGSPNRIGFAQLKPDVSAPGVDIRSASSTIGSKDDYKYSVKSGTSMACPHVAAVAALALSANPTLTVEELFNVLRQSVDQKPVPPNNGRAGAGQDVCGEVPYTVFPNYHYGHGRISAAKAVQLAQATRAH